MTLVFLGINDLDLPGTFGSYSFHLIDPLMLLAAAYAELGDGDAALHRYDHTPCSTLF